MLYTKCSFILPMTGLLCCLLLGPGYAQDKPEVDMTSEACIDCHDDIPAFSHKTLHNPSFNVRCEDCHTGSAEHIDDPEPYNIIKGGAEGQKLCLSCHATVTDGSHFWNGKHAGMEIQCSDCHQAHSSEKPRQKLLAKAPNELCISCHTEVQSAFNKPFVHSLGHGGVDCVSCHDIHNNKHFAKEPEGACLSCHQEKRGPFVFEHVTGIAGDCLSCHEAHGSANPMQLTRPRVEQLCLECHSTQPTATFGSQPPAIHDLRSPRYRNCTTCHTAVHGSHSSPLLLK